MNLQELTATIGRHGSITVLGGVGVTVQVIDVKMSYGKVRYLVKPLNGWGSAWVENFILYAEKT